MKKGKFSPFWFSDPEELFNTKVNSPEDFEKLKKNSLLEEKEILDAREIDDPDITDGCPVFEAFNEGPGKTLREHLG